MDTDLQPVADRKFELSPAQAGALVTHPHKTRYDMDHVHVRKDGSTETTDGRIWIRVIPPRPPELEKEFLIRAKAASKAAKERQKPTKKRPVPPPIIVDIRTGALSYRTSNDVAVEIPDAVNHSTKFPPAHDVEAAYSKMVPEHHAFLNVKVMEKMLAALRKGGVDYFRLDFIGSKQALRIKAIADGHGVVGVIMPCASDSVPAALRPKGT